jgi:two-component system sensor histidine kinase RegB
MTAEVLERVGEPFFTTKVPGEGMGLGLFLTRALAEQLGGAFHLTSRPGIGTEACFELPALDAGGRSGS